MEYELVAYTQVYENGRPKGGDEHVIATLSIADVVELGQDGMARKVHDARCGIEFANELCEEFVTGWDIRAKVSH